MSFNISDDGIFQLTKVLYTELQSQKNMKQLDQYNIDEFKRMYIKPLYPHKQQIQNGQKVLQKYECGQYCCEISPGRFACCSTTPPDSQYKQFGIGVCLYVKFMKHIAIFLFFVALLAMLSVAVHILGSIQMGIEPTKSYNYMIYSTTIGILSSQYQKCEYSQIKSNSANFNLQCSIGSIGLLKPTFSTQSLSTISNCGKQNMKYLSNLYIPPSSTYTQTVSNSSPSNYSINVVLTSNNYNNTDYKYLSYNYMCNDNYFNIANKSIPQIYALYLVVGIDLFIALMFVMFLWSQHRAESKEVEYFKQKELAVHDFAVKIKGFTLKNYQQQLQQFINGYNRMKGAHPSQQYQSVTHFVSSIVQIKVPEVEQIRQATQKRRKQYQKIYQLMSECFFQDQIDILRYKDANDFIRKCYGTNQAPQYKQYKKQLTQLVVQFMDSKRVKYDYNTDKIKISILMVLTNPKYKRQLIKDTKNKCCGHYLKINNNKYYISEPPIADMIIWQNKNKFTFIRVILSWIITLGICLCSYLLVGFASYQQQMALANNLYNINCDMLYTSIDISSYSQILYDTNSQQYLQCYCSTNYFSWDKQNNELRTICSGWISNFITYQSIPILISLGIVIYNLIVSRIYRVLSRFEAHQQLSSQLYSYIMKRSFMLIMNMGLIIILLKLNFKSTFSINNLSFLFMGIYTDITTDWYYDIGVIIIMTLAINILIPFFDMLFVSFLKCVRKCWDRRCYCRKTSQKTKKGYLALYSNDVFPIQERYADFIAMCVIVLTFSAVMPVLYIILFLSIWFMFISDKLLLFRVYQKPINYTKDLQNNVFKIVYVSIMIHCVVSPFLLSQPHLMLNNTNTSVNINLGNINLDNGRFMTIITTPYLIPYAALFVLLAAWAIFYSTIVKFCAYCTKKCEKQLGKVYKSKYHQNFYAALSQYQLNKLKLSTQLQLNSSLEQQSLTGTSHASSNVMKLICHNTLSKVNQALKRKTMQSTSLEQENCRLIGKAGYDEMLDDQVFMMERKIKSLDYQFSDILRKEKVQLGEFQVQHTQEQINLNFN